MITREEVLEALRPITDPEMHLSIVDLGLIYDIIVTAAGAGTGGGEGVEGKDGEGVGLEVRMTLTSPMCPYGPLLYQQVSDVAGNLPGVRETRVELVWEPPWDPSTMASDEAKDLMNIW
jgi:metal-sulfur cluster biosynthetic enzyme